MKSLLPTVLKRKAEAMEHDTRLAIDEGNLRNGNLNRPPTLFLELDGQDIDGAAGDHVLCVMIRRPRDNKIARMNVRLHATSDGNAVIMEAQTNGTTEHNTVSKSVRANFCWIQNENGDLDYPKATPNATS